MQQLAGQGPVAAPVEALDGDPECRRWDHHKCSNWRPRALEGDPKSAEAPGGRTGGGRPPWRETALAGDRPGRRPPWQEAPEAALARPGAASGREAPGGL